MRQPACFFFDFWLAILSELYLGTHLPGSNINKNKIKSEHGSHIRLHTTYNLSYIHLGSSVCHPVCCPVIFLSSCHSCGTLSYSLCYSNQADQVDETEGFEREGYRWRDRRWKDWRGRVWIDFSLFKPSLINMNVHSATCSCSVALYKQWYNLADFFPKLRFSRGFLYI